MNKRYNQVSSEVYYMTDSRVVWDQSDITFIKDMASVNPRRRCRLCAHPSTDHALHEMLIIHGREAYVRPHRHLGKAESFQVIQGSAIAAFFDERGGLVDARRMTPVTDDGAFYYRIPDNMFHCLIIESEWLVFHECTQGPFVPERSEFAQWSPDGENSESARAFLDTLRNDVQSFIS